VPGSKPQAVCKAKCRKVGLGLESIILLTATQTIREVINTQGVFEVLGRSFPEDQFDQFVPEIERDLKAPEPRFRQSRHQPHH
jgi:hypothetical protein